MARPPARTLLIRLPALFISLVFLLSATCAMAHPAWQPVRAEDFVISEDGAQRAAGAIILYREEVADDSHHFTFKYVREKILSEDGRDYANVRILYFSDLYAITELQGRTLHADGSITEFDGQSYDRPMYSGSRLRAMVKTFTLPHVEVGSIIEYRYKQQWLKDLPFSRRWIIQEDLMQKHVKLAFVPAGHRGFFGRSRNPVYWAVSGTPPGLAPKANRKGTLEMELHDVPAFEPEEFSLVDADLKMRASFFYGKNKSFNVAKFWRDEGSIWSAGADKFIGHSQAVAEEAAKVIAAGDSDEQKARKLYLRVQQIENPGGVRGLSAAALKTYRFSSNIEGVVTQNIGGHLDINRAYAGLLRAAGIKSYMMRLGTREGQMFDADLPDWSQLTDEIVVARIDGKDLFLDPGTRYCPYGLLRWQYTMLGGLRQVAGGTEIAHTPPPDASQTVTRRNADFSLDPAGNLAGNITVEFTGQSALVYRMAGWRDGEDGQKELLTKQLTEWLPASAQLKVNQVEGGTDENLPLVAHFSVTIPSYAASAGERLLVPSEIFAANTKQVFTRDRRLHAIFLPYPFREVDQVSMALPAGVEVEGLPRPHAVSVPFSSYHTMREQSGRTLIFNRDLTLGATWLPADAYPELRGFYKKVKAGDEEQAVLRINSTPQNRLRTITNGLGPLLM